MPEYSMKELEYWNKRIEELVHEEGLNCYEQEFELVGFEEMIACEAYAGMPSHYPHWSFGKAYERIKTLNKYNLAGLPYEMVINTNPCIAYLMKDNSLLLQILTMAHVYGHNDFFKNNRLFRTGTRAEYAVEMFFSHTNRVREYISDPSIGYAKVERVINAAHALRYQCRRNVAEKKLDDAELKKRLLEKAGKKESKLYLFEPPENTDYIEPDLNKIPLEPEEDILYFVECHGRLEEWEKDIIRIVREETQYFVPQIETKIINEGWATFWHYRLLNKLNLPQGMYFEFLKRHNQVVKPYEGSINPYFLGFKMFEYLYENNDMKKLFEIREIERDESFIRRYLNRELCCELKLYEYEKEGNEYVVTEVADEEGWMKIRDTIALCSGMNNIPVICVTDWNQGDNTLLLEHMFDGRELEIQYANETLKHLVDLWKGRVILNTVFEGKKISILCDEQKRIVFINT